MKRKPARSDTDTILTLMFEVGRIIRRAMVARDSMPLPLSSIETLRFVEEKGTPTMRDIAGYLRITAPSATALVECLVGSGFLSRKEDAKDRRVVRVSLTKKGATLLAKVTRRRMEALRKLVSALSAADRAHFISILSKIVH